VIHTPTQPTELDTLKSTLSSTLLRRTGDALWATSNQKEAFTGKAVRLLFEIAARPILFIINSLQVVYKHWYRLRKKSYVFHSFSVSFCPLCIIRKSNNLFKSGVLGSSSLLKYWPVIYQTNWMSGSRRMEIGSGRFDIDFILYMFSETLDGLTFLFGRKYIEMETKAVLPACVLNAHRDPVGVGKRQLEDRACGPVIKLSSTV